MAPARGLGTPSLVWLLEESGDKWADREIRAYGIPTPFSTSKFSACLSAFACVKQEVGGFYLAGLFGELLLLMMAS